MNNVLLMLGALLVGILAALVAVPMMVDWNGYRGVFEEEASRLMGRDVRVGGSVVVRILPVPYVRFEKLRIADTASTGGDPLFRADSVMMRLSVAPLLRGVLEAQSVELKRPQLRLAVDAEGRGNWRSLAVKGGSLPFVPADVSLQSVGIVDGTFVFAGASGKDMAQFENVAGELSADSFEGPFKFKGAASWYGQPREIRLSTAKSDPDGTTKLRATVRLPTNQNSYQFDGRLLDLKGKPRVEGDLSARLPVSTTAGSGQPAKPGDLDGNAFELKAKLDGDLSGGRLSDIALSLDQAGDPQLVTGTVTATWGDALAVQMALASRSFNLDRFALDRATSDPLATARTALGVILATLPSDAETAATFKADRVTLGGEPITGVSMQMSRRAGVLEVRDLRALLPGTTRLEAVGEISRDEKSPGFTGPVSVRGANLARFLAWARRHDSGAPTAAPASGKAVVPHAPTAPAASVQFEGPFAVEGQLAFAGGTLDLTGVHAELAGLPLTADLRVTSEGRRKIVLALQGARLDAAQVWPGGFDVDRLRTFLISGGAGKSGEGLYGFNSDTTDLKLDLRSADLQLTPSTSLRDVDAAIVVDHGKLTLQRLRFATADGLAIDLDGQLAASAASANPLPTPALPRRGTIRWSIAATTPRATTELIGMLDWPVATRPSEATTATLAAFGPLRLAGSTAIGERGASTLDVTIDGTIDAGRVTASARFDQGLAHWRIAPLDATASIETSNIDRWIALTGLATRGSATGSGPARAGQIELKTEGRPQTGLTALAQVKGDGLALAYQGMVTNPSDGQMTLEGTTTIAARDATEALALAGLSLGQGPSQAAVEGHFDVKYGAGKLTLQTFDTRLAGAAITGKATLLDATKAASVARTLDATIEVDSASIQGLLGVLLDRRSPGGGAGTGQSGGAVASAGGGAVANGTGSIWPDRPFSLAGLDALEGRVRLSLGQLKIDGPVGLTDARADIVLGPTGVAIPLLSGKGFGGTWTGNLILAKAASGVAMTSDLALKEGAFSGMGGAISGPVALSATLKSAGLSPSGLVSALQGQGLATLGAGTIKGLAPGGVTPTVDRVLVGQLETGGDELALSLKLGLQESVLPYAGLTVPFSVTEGIARADTVTVRTAEGRSMADTSVDLNHARFASDWRIEAAARPGATGKPKPPLPPVAVSYSGTLAAAAQADVKVSTAAFEQEMVVRKLERDVEELERLRKLDEDRRLQEEEAERKRATDAAAAAAALAIPATVQPAPAAADGTDGVGPVPAPVEAVRPKAETTSATPTMNAGVPLPDAVPTSAAGPPSPAPATAPSSPPRSQANTVPRRQPQAVGPINPFNVPN